MKSFGKLAAISVIAGAVSAQTTTLTGYGIGPTNYGSTSENQTLFEISNAHPNFTKSASITADTSPSETWDWAVNVTDILTEDSNHTINTVISLTWPQQSTANSVCAIAINAAPTYKTNPGDDGSCTDVLSGCLDDLTTAVSKGMVSADGTSQCGTAFSNVSVPSTCTSFFSGSSVNVSASPLGNLQSGKAWLYSATIGASPSLDDSATRVWPLFLMHSAGANITSFANPICLQAEASKSASATSSGTASATGTAATATSTKKSGAAEATVGKGLVLSAVGLAMMVLMV